MNLNSPSSSIMFFSELISSPLFFFVFFLAPLVSADDPLFHICSTQENYTAYSPYASNLNSLFTLLSDKAPPTGFGLCSVGQGLNQVNGLALCRGDVSSTNCKTCVVNAGKELHKRCPNRKGSIIWYDYCLLKYSDSNFFGQIDNSNKFYMYNIQETDQAEKFNGQVRSLLRGLAGKVGGSEKLYVTGELELEGSKKLYGLVQCTRDLSRSDCRKCIDGAITELPFCCNAKIGGRVVGGSCNFRYELYPIVDSQA